MCFGDCIFGFGRLELLYCGFFLYRIQPPEMVDKMTEGTVNCLFKSLALRLKHFKSPLPSPLCYPTTSAPPRSQCQALLGKTTVRPRPHWTLFPCAQIYLFQRPPLPSVHPHLGIPPHPPTPGRSPLSVLSLPAPFLTSR